jgi:methylamine dehydrogenase accessory protein MauD
MHPFWIAAILLLWLVVLFTAFLLLGTLRALGRVRWRLQQLEATTPSRLGRRGVRRGTKAPDFTLPSIGGREVALSSFAGREVFLVFTQAGCGPCRSIVPHLNRLHQDGELVVLVVNNGDVDSTERWAREVEASFPVLVQEGLIVSRRYEAFATPFAFLISEQRVIRSKGIITEPEHIDFVLSSAIVNGEEHHAESGLSPAERRS